jgi:hypothetical protein
MAAGIDQLLGARPEMRDFGRDQGVRKILPEAYG